MQLSHIQAWASALPSDSNRQCEKPPIVGRATSTDSHAFFVPAQIWRCLLGACYRLWLEGQDILHPHVGQEIVNEAIHLVDYILGLR